MNSKSANHKTCKIELSENYTPNCEPIPEEIREYAKFLGMDLEKDIDLLYIAKEGLKAPLPICWKACKTPRGFVYYINLETKESTWDHPLNQYYRSKYQEAKSLLKPEPLKQSPKRKIRLGARVKRKDKTAGNIECKEDLQRENVAINALITSQEADTNESLTMIQVNHYRYITPRRESQPSDIRLQIAAEELRSKQGQQDAIEDAKKSIKYEEQEIKSIQNLPHMIQALSHDSKIEEHLKNRFEELEFYRDKKQYELAAKKEEVELKYKKDLRKLKEIINGTDEAVMSPRSKKIILDAKIIEEIQKNCNEIFHQKREAIVQNFEAEEKSLVQELSNRNQEKIREMTNSFRIKVKVSTY